MNYEYGIFSSTCTSCILYKRDEDGDQSVFNLNVIPQKDGEKKQINLYIDNNQTIRLGGACLIPFPITPRELITDDVFEEYGKWYDGSDPDFDLKTQDAIRQLLRNELREADFYSEKEEELGFNLGMVNAKIKVKKGKKIK